MVWPTQDVFLRYPIRTAIAVSGRSVRRVHPLGSDRADRLECRIAAIGAAECIAAGEQLLPSTLAEILQEAKLTKLSESSEMPADRAAGSLGFAVLRAVQIIEDPDGAPKKREVIAPACAALLSGLEAAPTALDNETLRMALKRDLDRFEAESHHLRAGEDDWVGAPTEPGAMGPFGELWPEGRKPSWYEPPPPRIAALDPGQEVGSGDADIFCWHVGGNEPDAEGKAQSVVRAMKNIREQVVKVNGAGLPPIFVVHAPNLDDRLVAQLVIAGATVLDNSAFETSAPGDSSELAHKLSTWITGGEAGGLADADGWNLDDFRYL